MKEIIIKGAREHNLKGIDVKIPHNKLVVITGVSGSGKSSLAFDTIFREGQRRYLESFSLASTQLISKLYKPDVYEIKGLTPTIAVNQSTVIRNPRSTVGTLTELYDHLRLLFARLGKSEIEGLKIDRQLFSFNHHKGWCAACKGLGIEDKIDPELLIDDDSKSVRDGCLVITAPNGYIIYSQVTLDVLNQVCNAHGFDIDIPWKHMTHEQKDVILYGSESILVPFGKHTLESRMKWTGITAKPREEGYYKGVIPVMEEILKRDRNKNILRFVRSYQCESCQGQRLNEKALSVTIDNNTIAGFASQTVNELNSYFKNYNTQDEVFSQIQEQVVKKTELLRKLGLSYLTLDRESTSLSGGKAQRIRLANQLGNGLEGITYVFDEPSIGLHASEQQKMLEVLNSLVNQGNNVIVVEHDETTIRSADYLIDIGPKAGIHGGKLMFQGTIEAFEKAGSESITEKWLFKSRNEPGKKQKRKIGTSFYVRNATKNNLQNFDVEFKSNSLNVITGVSGAGKSSLVEELVEKSFDQKNSGTDQYSKLIKVDQSPIGRTPRSNPATYTKLFDLIRDAFGKLEETKERGWSKSRFSFNNKGGRCESCEGAGYKQISMHFLGNVDVLCESCQGKRFNDETLEVKYNGKNIYEVLELKISEALHFFEDHKNIVKILKTMNDLGLGYIGLGQPSTTLSGGEAQRIKLATELRKTSSGNILYVLDEPTTGLHDFDIQMLLKSINSLIEAGHTIIVIEHELEIIKHADWVIDLGPGSGKDGGQLIANCTVDELLLNQKSLTSKALRNSNSNFGSSTSTLERHIFSNSIRLKNVSTHNLKNIDVGIPKGKITTITGVSGSGKSSLAFDTLFAEGQNRFMESISTYARSFMKNLEKANVESIEGLSPVIAIGQKNKNQNPRSTAGTLTEVYDFYRLLYSRISENQRLTASSFSFNREAGACIACGGLGVMTVCDPEKLITNPERSILNGAMDGHKTGKFYGDPYGQYVSILKAVGKDLNIDYEIAWDELSEQAKEIALSGTADNEYNVVWNFKRKNREGEEHFTSKWKGLLAYVNEEYERKHADKRGDAMLPIMKDVKCFQCNGQRLHKEALNVKFEGLNIADLSNLSVIESIKYFEKASNTYNSTTSNIIVNEIVPEILSRLKSVERLGLGYLQLDRSIQSLSGGELQRLRLASQLKSRLCKITYILDEPTIGLHSKDTESLSNVIQDLKNEGNTIVIVEHDEDMIQASDHILEIGPGAGEKGGELLYSQSAKDFKSNPNSITSSYLSKPHKIEPLVMKTNAIKPISIQEINCNNLRNLDLEIPSNGMTVITGVSGSGKSTMVFDVLKKSFGFEKPTNCKSINNIDQFNALLSMDQSPIGNNPSSIIATYAGVFDNIRSYFAKHENSRSIGLTKNHFSFNNKSGRCNACHGMGQTKISMDFLSDIWIDCDECNGKRYNELVLTSKIDGLSIYDVMEMEISEAKSYFTDHKISRKLSILESAGLGYLKLGQQTRTLSGGEAQRLKLASEIIKSKGERNLYLFDEPTTGLHFKDIEVLLQLFKSLIEQGHTLVVIEHNLQLISKANHIIDFGPEGGEKGGKIVFEGKVDDLIDCKESFTGQALSKKLKS